VIHWNDDDAPIARRSDDPWPDPGPGSWSIMWSIHRRRRKGEARGGGRLPLPHSRRVVERRDVIGLIVLSLGGAPALSVHDKFVADCRRGQL